MKTGELTRRRQTSPPLSSKGLKAGSRRPRQGDGKHLPHYPAKGLRAGSRGPDKETANISPNIQQGLKAGSIDPDKETASISPIILQRPESR